jgi:hypothetical protein
MRYEHAIQLRLRESPSEDALGDRTVVARTTNLPILLASTPLPNDVVPAVAPGIDFT